MRDEPDKPLFSSLIPHPSSLIPPKRSYFVMDLSTVHQGVHKLKKKKRVGRGPGSGHGKTASRGSKGQYASAGAHMPFPVFEGGQMQLFRRIPKRGFSNARFQKDYLIVNVGDLDAAFNEGD